MASFISRLLSKFRKQQNNVGRSRRERTRKLRLEHMEHRRLMASDIASIGGNVFTDLLDDGTKNGLDTDLVGVNVRLFRDGGNNTFDSGNDGTADPDDVLVGTDLTDAGGNYLFEDLGPGRYFVQQAAAPGRLQRPAQTLKTVVISDADSEGIGVLTIDNFTDDTASILANSGSATASSFTATTLTAGVSNTVGNERDLVVNHTAGLGDDITARVSLGVFRVSPNAGISGNAILTFDGNDGDASTVAHNILNLNLNADGAEAFQFLAGSEAGNTLSVIVHSGSGNFSTRTISIPVTVASAPTEIVTIRFDDPAWVDTGTGANFASVTAIQLQVNAVNGADAQIDLNQTVRPFLNSQNFANLNPMSIGDRVWRDTDNDGTLDGGESGIQNVTVQAYLDDGDNVFDAGDTLSGSGTTDATGNYLISNLLPGNYFVVVPSSNFTGGGALVGHTASTTVQAPNTDSNNSNKGAMVAGAAVTTAALTLSSAGEPTTDGDADNNSNLTLDFGFAAEIDLEIEKAVNSGTITAGNQVTYTLTVTNNGPGVANNVLVVDDLPNFMTVTAGNITATPDGTVTLTGDPAGEIEVGYASLASGATRTITIVATIPAAQAAQANVVNTATVTGDGIDIPNDNNEDTASINVVRQAVLQITKTDTPDPVLVGQALNYQIVVTNTGVSTATNVVIRDTLPTGLTFNSINSTVGTATHTAGLIALDLPSLAVGASVTINVGTTVLSTFAGTTIANTATADADEAALVTAQADTDVRPQLDLRITKTDSADPASRGGQLTYTLTVRNDGPSGATNVQVVDTLPPDVTYVSATVPGGATLTPPVAPSRDVTIGLGNMASGAEATISIVVTVNQNAGASFTNTAVVRSTESQANPTNDTNIANNTATQNTATQRVIDLAITKVDSATVGSPIRPGGTVTYTMTATNNGPSDATLVRVTDNIPDGLRITSATIGATAITIPASASDTNASNPDDLIFDIGNLANGASATLTVIANVLPEFRSDLLNTAVISTTEAGITEGPTTNNTASVTSPLSALADVGVTKTSPSGATVIAGNALVYHIDVTNNGPSTATNVNISDTLPAGLTFGSVSSQQGTVSHANGVITGNLGTIAPNATVRVTVNTTVAAATRGNVSNTVTVTRAESDNNSANDTSTIVTTIDPQIDLRISKAKTNPNDPAIAGGPLTYSIIVTNDGPSTATNVVMTDVLPNGLTFTQGSSTVGNVNAAGQTVTANIGTLAPGASATITIEASVASSAAGTLSNTATVTGTERDNLSGNNSSTLNTPIAVTGSISGLTYIDADRNGVLSSGESGVAGVTMTLTGTDILGRTVSRTATTNANGEYTFADVHPGTYTVTQTQPLGLQSLQNNVGTPAGGTAGDNLISNVVVTSGVNAVAYNFGEVPNPLSKRRFLASSDQFD